MNHRIEINLSKCVGAQCLNVTFPNGKTMAAWVIPAAYNDMVYTDKEGNTKVSGNIKYVTQQLKEETRQNKAKENADKQGYIAPSHYIKPNYSKDFREKAKKAAEVRIKKENPTISEEELKTAVSNAVAPIVGQMTPFEEEQMGVVPSGNAVAQAVTTPQFGELQPEDELPF